MKYRWRALGLEEGINVCRPSELFCRRKATVTPDISVVECMMVTAKGIRHEPVDANDSLSGGTSIGDVVKFIISEQNILIEDLQGYIKGTYL